MLLLSGDGLDLMDDNDKLCKGDADALRLVDDCMMKSFLHLLVQKIERMAVVAKQTMDGKDNW